MMQVLRTNYVGGGVDDVNDKVDVEECGEQNTNDSIN